MTKHYFIKARELRGNKIAIPGTQESLIEKIFSVTGYNRFDIDEVEEDNESGFEPFIKVECWFQHEDDACAGNTMASCDLVETEIFYLHPIDMSHMLIKEAA